MTKTPNGKTKTMIIRPLTAGFVRVMENLKSHGIFKIRFPGLEIHGILVWSWKVMKNENYCIKTSLGQFTFRARTKQKLG